MVAEFEPFICDESPKSYDDQCSAEDSDALQEHILLE